MLKIRLTRIGRKKRPFYRVVVVDERAKRTGAYIELLGTYNPLTEPKDIKLKQDRIDYWIKNGAQLSDGFLRIIGQAPQKPPRKPKKKAQETTGSEQKKPEASQEPEETAKSSEPEATGEVESAPEAGHSEDSDSQQARSEASESTSEPQQSEPNGASATDELPQQPEAEKSAQSEDEESKS